MDSFHDSYTSIAGGTLMLNMMFGEVAPGGTGSGMYGILILAVITVFVAGLMIGRTPEYIGKKIGAREMKFASLYLLTTPMVVLVGTAAAMALPDERAAMLNSGAHGLSEVCSCDPMREHHPAPSPPGVVAVARLQTGLQVAGHHPHRVE